MYIVETHCSAFYTTFIIIDLEDVRRTAVRLYNDNKQNPHKLFVHEDFVYYLFENYFQGYIFILLAISSLNSLGVKPFLNSLSKSNVS